MKKQLLFLFTIILSMVVKADPVMIDGIYYNLVSKLKTAEVTSNPQKYSGSVVIPQSVTYENVEYNVTSIGAKAFYECRGLTSVTIPNSVTTIGYDAFNHCTALKSVTIPSSVTTIDGYAFHYCSGLKSVVIKNGVKYVGYNMFAFCLSLTSITIPNSVTGIGQNAFYSCSSLTSITIPSSVVSIGNDAFSQCTSLTSVKISDIADWCKISFGNVSSNPLYYAHHLFVNDKESKDLVVPNSVTTIDKYTFYGCSGLTSVTIPNSVTDIGYCAFEGCTGLTSVKIPDSIKYLELGVFNGCSALASVTIGSGVIGISYQAFASCPELTDVYCYAKEVPSTDSRAFEGSYTEYATLHVPEGLIDTYKASDPWKNFKNIVATDGDTPDTPPIPKCEKPTISYVNGQLKFASATDGVAFLSEITDSDIKKNYEATVMLSATYIISVYATKDGYDNSDVTTATLCWIDKEPTTEGIDGISQIRSNAVLIQSEEGVISLQGIDDGTQTSVYTVDGVKVGSAISRNGGALLNTNLRPGTTAIVKVGEKSVKILIK